ncbi:BrnT family toxin [Luteimonas notoginsengisoli]|uniref:BrnT family toxin n=1 Tax=Luteimonas notoginsengisoli TaxID=1578200 RepID=A0ABV7URR0_9GAMM
MATDMDVHFEYHGNTFVRNADKARANVHKHGVAFEEAVAAFLDRLFVLVDASRNDESRDAVIGFDAGGRLLYVVHLVIEGEVVRVVKARRATAQEGTLYAQ